MLEPKIDFQIAKFGLEKLPIFSKVVISSKIVKYDNLSH
jgi:hypothetical protein